MFDNIGTALVQAVGFFCVKKVNKTNDLKDKFKKQGLFGRKKEPINEELKPNKKGLFGKKVEPAKPLKEPKKKGWFR